MKTKSPKAPPIYITTDVEWSDHEWEMVNAKAAQAGLTIENYLRARLGYPPIE